MAKLPRCAYCGADFELVGQRNVLMEFEELPGKPTIAWCCGEAGSNDPMCWGADPIAENVHDRNAPPKVQMTHHAVVLAVAERSRDRVVAGLEWWTQTAGLGHNGD